MTGYTRAFLSLLALCLAGCGQPASPSNTPELAGGARPTIVSLNPCTDAILAEVAAPEQLLAISHYSHDPRASSMDLTRAVQFRATGGTVEEVLALDPDILFAGSFMAPATRAALEDLGLRVETFGIASTIEESIAQVRRLAELSGNPEAGERLVAQIEAAAEPARGAQLSAVLWQPGGIVPGETQLVSELLRRAGFSNHAAAQGLGQADYLSLEQVVANPPDVLLVAGATRGQSHPVLDELYMMHRADFDTQLLYCGGPTIIRAMERLRGIREDAA
ncbi:ABC transporter substrate-binding protein [Qipengyuania sp. DGS5-3]|uniref:ABC transporter substrate-binding protein n=1 Tax=Qipengyuania sp. DGS5-3 TaxID=3349632 RepID=UPI0036D2F02C